jgi:phosphoribosylanthranilate isomerase
MRVRVKICGVTSEADARRACALGVDAVGLNFYPHSVRGITVPTAETLLRVLPSPVEAFGVFVNQSMPHVLQTLGHLRRIRTIQWYGPLVAEDDPSPFQFIPAFAVRNPDSLREITRYLDRCRELGRLPAAVLVDAHVAGQYGGTGQRAPWEMLADFQPGVPLILAGGLTPENVAEAIRLVRPAMVDVASGVECRPGLKDAEKMRRFIDAAREAGETVSAAG